MLHISPGMRLALVSLIAIGTIAGLFSAYKRFHVEAGNRRVEIALEWQEVSLLAQTAHRPVEDVLAQFKKSRATTLVLLEDTLNSLEQSGYLHPNRSEMKSSVSNCIVDVPDSEMFERIYAALKLRGLKPYSIGNSDSNSPEAESKPQTPLKTAFRTVSSPPDSSTKLFYVNTDYSALRTVGIGLSPEALIVAKNAGYRIAGRIGNSSGINEAATFDLLKALYDQGVSTVIFTGDEVLGYRGLEKQVASLLKPNLETGHNPFPGMSYGEVEFGKQKGDEKLSVALNGDYIRVHSIQPAEMSQLDEEEAVDRFVRAARERNIRFCYVRLFTLVGNDPVADNAKFIGKISNRMAFGSQKVGGTIGFGAANRFEDPAVSKIVFTLIGLGTGAGFLWALLSICPVPTKASIALLVASCLCCAGLAFLGETGRKLTAFFAGVIFPTIACLVTYPTSPTPKGSFLVHPEPVHSTLFCLIAALRSLIIASLITGIGIVQVIGLLSSRPFMVHAEQFLGPKAQHVLPLFIVALVALVGGLRASEENWVRWRDRCQTNFQKVLDEPARFGMLLLGIVSIAALALVVARTGNDAGVGVSATELKIRNILDRQLPVRPRTKEFLVGHPAYILALAWWWKGRKRLAIPAFIVGSLGQVSLLNTFCHIHTPMLVSLWRDSIGLVFGAIFGSILFLVLEKVLPPVRVEGRDKRRR